ncbi:hypothetical protein, partial [Streptococcus pneumoniae]|uniref:hypothetical protein n=1 Tax=Streptococcus pneumoniae TaxID=1313 RepID=UPI0018B077C0
IVKKVSDINNVYPEYRSQVLDALNPNKLLMGTIERRLNLILDWWIAKNDPELGYHLDISGYKIDDAWRMQDEWHKA